MGGHIRVVDENEAELAKSELNVEGFKIGGEVVSGETAIRFNLDENGEVDVTVVTYVDGVEVTLGSLSF